MSNKEILIVFGTRPEVLKLAPVIKEVARREGLVPVCVSTGQHDELVRIATQDFDIKLDHDLKVMSHAQSLSGLSARVLSEVSSLIEQVQPAAVIVQGDTTSTAMAALSAFHAGIPVAHVEAGLRSGDKRHPFPEEVNRRLVSTLADLHFAPTPLAAQNLLSEGISSESVFVTGNTVVDTLHLALERSAERNFLDLFQQPRVERLILVTSHRRENHGAPMEELGRALLEILEKHRDVGIVFPVHPNPAVRKAIHDMLGESPRIALLPPMSYFDFVAAMQASTLIITDSGGIQEEAPVLGKPVLVFRRVTERPEAVAANAAKVVGIEAALLVEECDRLLTDASYCGERSRPSSPFGDGRAAMRIVDSLQAFLRTDSHSARRVCASPRVQ